MFDNSRSVIQEPSFNLTGPSSSSFVIDYASTADSFPVWGTQRYARDALLRKFWPSEPVLASAMFSTISKYTAFGWRLKGPRRQVNITREVLHNSQNGKGWHVFNIRLLQDLFGQDNGAFYEILRRTDDPVSPVLAVNHLDAARCVRTGRNDYPVVYQDLLGRYHKMAWYQVATCEEFPSPIEHLNNIQLCTVSRLLMAARILRDIQVYKHEKVSGQYTGAVHLVSGVSPKLVEDSLALHRERAQQEGLQRYITPLILGSISPEANVTKATIELASLPDGFDEESTMRWYVNQLALAFGADYQDFAPLPGGNLGSAHQSQVLHLKSRGKGPALYMSLMEHSFNWQGVMPRTVKFKYGGQDVALDTEQASLRLIRAQERAARIASGEITTEIARQIAVDEGDLDTRYLDMLGELDLTQDITVDYDD